MRPKLMEAEDRDKFDGRINPTPSRLKHSFFTAGCGVNQALKNNMKFLPEAIPSIIAIFYNKIPAKAFGNFYREVAKEVAGSIRSGRILDIGTGPGYLPIEIAKLNQGLDILGVDLSPKMIEIARDNVKRKGAKNVTFELADAKGLPYERDCFDFVLSTTALHHWHDREGVFNNINRVLKKDGICWIYDLRRDATKDEISNTFRSSNGSFAYMRWAVKFHGLKTDEYYTEIKSLLESMKVEEFDIEKKGAFMRISWKKPKELN